ncbi:PD-(D/E)XK nuclease family protein [Aeromonas allosaccharophila]|uniref:PDDEXK-like family protein n=1 Tax=Aeromonas allosaccharophila TaxID=656 RepID=UPI003D1CF41A
MNGIHQKAAALLENVVRWTEVTRRAKSRYQAELAPDFSLMDWLKNDELALSRYLRFLLSPNESHGQSILFLKGFLSLIENLGHNSPIATEDCFHKARVDYEVIIENGRKIDLLLTTPKGIIAIENKPWAEDQDNQLRDYAQWLNKLGKPWKLIYLCNHEPSESSLPRDTPDVLKQHILTVSWYKVVEWLSDCLLYVRAGTVRVFIESLIKYVNQSINGEYIMDNSDELSEILKKDSHTIESAFVIYNQIEVVRKQLYGNLIKDLNEKLTNHNLKIKISDTDTSSRWAGFYISLDSSDTHHLSWQFDRANFNGLYFGISGISEKAGRTEKISAAISALFPHMQGKSNKYWSWWSWDLDPQGKNRIPHNWGNDGSVWAKLSERDEDSVFAALYEVIITVHDKMDMKLFS